MNPVRPVMTALSALLIAVLAACSSGSTAPERSVSSGVSEGGSGQRSVTDAEGTAVSVPDRPQRIVALSEPTLDGLVALGITPVGATAGRGQSTVPAYLADKLKGVPLLGAVAQPNYEAIAAATPDLIVVDGTSINNNAEAIARLRKIAPTVVTGYAGGDWRSNFTVLADAVNRAAAGKQVIADYDAHVASAKAALSHYAGKTFSIVRWQGGAPALILSELPQGIALHDVGLARPPAQNHKGPGHSDPVSLENLDRIDADYLFFGTLGGSSVGNRNAGGAVDVAASEQALAQARKVPGFDQLNAVEQGHVIPVDGSVWTTTGGPVLMNRIVSDIEAALA